MLSRKAKYGLQALLSLARQHGNGPKLIADLAEQEQIPKKFLELILLQLKNAGILSSRKGKGGGYFLAKDPAQITMGSAVRVLDGPLAPVPCVSETAYQKCTECIDEESCGIRLVMKDVRDAVAAILDSTTLKEVLVRSDDASKKAKKVIDYSI
ncbi:MAG: Rrf2 family transcriptional regulator [Geoalkalibacter sp.]|uniref:RrF2 family transcriptional regulator n=1 Tax=Geoalkalibacter sp. TaxID=3041440 RepID=UPI003D114A8B